MSTATDMETEIDPLKHLGLAGTIMQGFRDRGLDSEDLMQEAAIALIQASRAFRPELNLKFTTLAGKCILNQLIQTTRKSGDWKMARRELSDDPLARASEPADEGVRLKVSKLLECLTEMESKVIRLRFGLDTYPMTAVETAKVVERSASRVKQIQIRAIRRIRKAHGIEVREVA